MKRRCRATSPFLTIPNAPEAPKKLFCNTRCVCVWVFVYECGARLQVCSCNTDACARLHACKRPHTLSLSLSLSLSHTHTHTHTQSPTHACVSFTSGRQRTTVSLVSYDAAVARSRFVSRWEGYPRRRRRGWGRRVPAWAACAPQPALSSDMKGGQEQEGGGAMVIV